MNYKSDTVSETTHRVQIDRADLVAMLQSVEELPAVPDNADIYITVPGGGDWSHMDLDVSEEHPIVVTWRVNE